MELYKDIGDTIRTPSNSSEVIGYIFAVGDSLQKCKKEINKAKSILKFIVEN